MTAFGELAGEDAYELLGVPPDASKSEIQKAWRKRASAEHPDRVTDPDAKARAEERLRLVNAARDILASRRAAYDAFRDASRRADAAQGTAGDARQNDPWQNDRWQNDPWQTASQGRPADDPWATAATGRPRPAPPPPPPGYHPGGRVPPAPGPVFQAPRRRSGCGAKLGIGCAVFFAASYALFMAVILVGVLRSPRPAADVAVPSDLAGTWTGTVKEREGKKKSWDVRLTLKKGKNVGEVRYLKGKCTGKAVPISLQEKTLRVRADFPDDADRCDHGDLNLTRRKDGKVSLVYYAPTRTKKTATGVLRRS